MSKIKDRIEKGKLALQYAAKVVKETVSGSDNMYEPDSVLQKMEEEDKKVRKWLKEFHAARERGENPSPIYK